MYSHFSNGFVNLEIVVSLLSIVRTNLGIFSSLRCISYRVSNTNVIDTAII